MRKTILEPARRVPVLGPYDVVVVGGGPAGVASAVAAARQKANVLLVEQTGCLGGMSTAGLVPVLAPYSRTKEPLIRGIGLEIVERMHASGKVYKDYSGYGWLPVHAEGLKRVYDEIVAEAGVQVRYFTFAADVLRLGRNVRAVLLESKAGRQAAEAAVFIDATGDADVAARAGAKFDLGDADGKMQAASLCMMVSGVNVPKYWRYVDSRGDVSAWLRSLEDKKLLPRLKGAEYRGIHGQQVGPGVIGFNFGHVYEVNGTNPEDLSRIMTLGRRMAGAFVEYARKHMPGMEQAHLVATGALPGIRETRRIAGRARLTLGDYLEARHFPDDIARYDYTVDVHNASRNARLWKKFVQDFDSRALPLGQSYGIPFGSLVPSGLDNLLVAGRSLSSDRPANGSARTMPACFAMGQAAGTAAALAIKQGTTPAQLDVSLLQRTLRRAGALL